MNIGIVVHSLSGHTQAMAERIAQKLREKNHSVTLTQLQTDVPIKSGSVHQAMKFSIVNLPDCSACDAILVGGPVWAFSASPVIVAAIESLKNITGKTALPFATMAFPFSFMGGNQALGLMSRKLSAGGASVRPGFVVSRLFHDFQKEIDETAAKIAAMF